MNDIQNVLFSPCPDQIRQIFFFLPLGFGGILISRQPEWACSSQCAMHVFIWIFVSWQKKQTGLIYEGTLGIDEGNHCCEEKLYQINC